MIQKTEDLVGKVPLSIKSSDDQLMMVFEDGTARWYHYQDCEEDVCIEDINGDLGNLVGQELKMSEESSNEDMAGVGDYSETWTFYRFATIQGYVDIRWVGNSNGNYSESVNFEWIPKEVTNES